MSDTLTKAITKVTEAQVIDLKKSKARFEQEVSSIRDRVRDIEWRVEGMGAQEDIGNLLNERQRALDKLRETQRELLVVREQLIEAGIE